MSTILVVDGPRAAGKTTVAQAVVERCRAAGRTVELHKHPRPADVWKHMDEAISTWTFASHETIFVVDRFHLTEAVMSIALGRGDEGALRRQFEAMDRRLEAFGPHLRYAVLMAPVSELYRRPLQLGRKVDVNPEVAWTLWSTLTGMSRVAALRMNSTFNQLEATIEDFTAWALTKRRPS